MVTAAAEVDGPPPPPPPPKVEHTFHFGDLHLMPVRAVYARDVPVRRQLAANYAWVACFAGVGTVLRHYSTVTILGLSGDLVANAAGSALMGLLVGQSEWLAVDMPAAYAGSTTGLCGCFTTFSGWNVDAALEFARGEVGRGIATLGAGLATACLGLCLGVAASRRLTPPPGEQRRLPLYHTYKLQLAVGALCGEAAVFAAILASKPSTAVRVLCVGVLLAPLGACSRYALSTLNKGRLVPYWTLVANGLATLASALVARFAPPPQSTGTGVFLAGLSLGLSGGLSTVSSFVNELRLLLREEDAPERAAGYATASLGAAQLLALGVLSSS